jgi:hypothetical protein
LWIKSPCNFAELWSAQVLLRFAARHLSNEHACQVILKKSATGIAHFKRSAGYLGFALNKVYKFSFSTNYFLS